MAFSRKTGSTSQDKYSSEASQTQLLSDTFDNQVLELIERSLKKLSEGRSEPVSVDELAMATNIRPPVLLENLVKMQLRKQVELTRTSTTESFKDIYVTPL